jgi:hypothetical protein
VLLAWVVKHDLPNTPAKYIARLATKHPTIYVMAADMLAELQAMLLPGLERSQREPADPLDVVNVWFSK